jgi:hypothetical protein
MAQQRFIFDDQQFHNALLGKSTSPKAQHMQRHSTSMADRATPAIKPQNLWERACPR